MKIAILTLSYPPGCGGSGYYAKDLAEALAKHGHEVTVYTPAKSGLTTEYGVDIIQLTQLRPHVLMFNLHLLAISKVITKKKFDLVIHNEVAGSLMPSYFYKTSNSVMAMHHQTDEEHTTSYWRKIKVNMVQILQDRMVKKSSAVTFLTEYIRKDAVTRYHLNKPTFIVPCIVNDNFSPDNDIKSKDLTIFYPSGAGDNFERKGIGYFLPVFKSVYEKNPNIKLVISGGNVKSVDMIKVLASRLGILKVVETTSNLSFDKVMRYFNSADIVVFTSKYEGFGRPVIEALQNGKPLITSNTGVAPEVIKSGENGYISNSAQETEVFLTRLIRDRDLRNRVAKMAKQTSLLRFTESKIVKKIEDIKVLLDENSNN